MKIPFIFMLKPFFRGEFKTRPRQKVVMKPPPVTAGYRSNIKDNIWLSLLLLIYLFRPPPRKSLCHIQILYVAYPILLLYRITCTNGLHLTLCHSLTLTIDSWFSHKPRFFRHIEVANVQIIIRLARSLVEYLLPNEDSFVSLTRRGSQHNLLVTNI